MPKSTQSQYHIDGYLTDFECTADVEGVSDVQVFKRLLQGYDGPGVIGNEWGHLVFRTIGELGLKDHPMARFQPNGVWTELLPVADWPRMKAYVLNKLAPPKPKKITVTSTRPERIVAAMRTYNGKRSKRKGWPWVRPLRTHAGMPDITKAERYNLWPMV